MEDEPTQLPQSDASTTPETEWVTTLGGQLRADSIVTVKPDLTAAERQAGSTNDDMLFTTAHRAEVLRQLNKAEHPDTRRSLRQQEREAYIKNHPIKHLGYRALYRIFKTLSK